MPGYVKAGLLLPDCQDGLEEVQQILSLCNPWAQVNSWFLVKADSRTDKKFLTLNIPLNVVPALLEKDRRLSYLLGSYIRFFGPKGRLDNTSPPDKRKGIEKYLDRERNQQLYQNKDPNFENCRSSDQISLDNTYCDGQQNSTNSDGHRSDRNTKRSFTD